jgi:RNA polymerase sigma factor (TIGR02999 family)
MAIHVESNPVSVDNTTGAKEAGSMEIEKGQVTKLLKAMSQGDPEAADKLLPLVYGELHRLASSYMRNERPDHTLQATALINEAYLRLAREDTDWNSREHFIGVAANVMRRVLVDYARAHRAEQRGGGLKRVELQDDLAISAEKLDEVEALDEALRNLESHNPRPVGGANRFAPASVPAVGEARLVAGADLALSRITSWRGPLARGSEIKNRNCVAPFSGRLRLTR